MASKVKLSVRLDMDHEMGEDHYKMWRSQLEMAFLLHEVEDSKRTLEVNVA